MVKLDQVMNSKMVGSANAAMPMISQNTEAFLASRNRPWSISSITDFLNTTPDRPQIIAMISAKNPSAISPPCPFARPIANHAMPSMNHMNATSKNIICAQYENFLAS